MSLRQVRYHVARLDALDQVPYRVCPYAKVRVPRACPCQGMFVPRAISVLRHAWHYASVLLPHT
ncbi:hypothetical protein HAX54_050078, partial [Datura stramonium]|nr:hypothetical protein [Datura stramonium]